MPFNFCVLCLKSEILCQLSVQLIKSKLTMRFGRIYCVIELITDIGHCTHLFHTHSIRVQQISIGNANWIQLKNEVGCSCMQGKYHQSNAWGVESVHSIIVTVSVFWMRGVVIQRLLKIVAHLQLFCDQTVMVPSITSTFSFYWLVFPKLIAFELHFFSKNLNLAKRIASIQMYFSFSVISSAKHIEKNPAP